MAESGAASRRYGCPACGGGLRYEIASGKMICDRCGTLTALQDLPPETAEETLEVTEFHCPQCGAAVYSTDTEVTSFCSFCGSDVVLTGRLSRQKRPEEILPFSVSREDCEAAYRKHLKKYLLAPSELKKAETVSHFRPVYVPFWSYTVDAKGPAKLQGEKSYTKGNYRYDETYNLSMDAVIHQEGILYDASSAFEDETAAMLRHTARETVPFHPAYLSGFYAQGADVPGETYHAEAAASAVRIFMDQVKEENEMDSVTLKGDAEDNFGLPHAKFREKLVMMPVWLLAHRTGQRVVYTAVNGRSGEVVCDVPVSNGKVLGVTLGLAAVLFVLLYLFVTLRPELLLAFCAMLSLITQYQFSGAQKLLFNRRTRAFEPHPEEGKAEFMGPAQARLARKDGRIISRGSTASMIVGKAKSWGLAGVCILAYGVFSVVTRVLSSAGTSKDRRMIALFVLLAVLAVMAVHMFRRLRKEWSGPSWPRIVSCLACAAGFISLAAGQAEDLVYYACAAALLLASAVELVMINRAHNEYASRPVPFFGEKEDAE